MIQAERDYFYKSHWDDGVELAYVLNDVIELNKKWKRYNLTETAKQTMQYDFRGKSTELGINLDRIGWGHKQKMTSHAGWRGNAYMPQPYLQLTDLADSFWWAAFHDKNSSIEDTNGLGKNGSRSLDELESKIHEIVGNLIGREVTVDVVDPYTNELGQLAISGIV